MVYMAADNSLAPEGRADLQQMAAAGVNPEVQVVVQAEFSPTQFAQAGLTPASVDRTNYNTFRYVMDGSVSGPPNHVLFGPATDIGNVNMTDPAQLRAFVQWAEQTAPSLHTVLVLWNHGNQSQGLIEDDTSAPNILMSMSQLTSALSGLPTFDVIDFQMCLMAGYEPLSAVRGLTQTAVASEQEELVTLDGTLGWNFTRFLQVLYNGPTASATSIAVGLANAFDAGYVGQSSWGTISAFNMSGFAAVDGAVSQLANSLANTSAANVAGVSTASASAQRYGLPWIVDLVDLSDSLRAHVSDPSVTSAAAAVRQAITSPSFLLANHVHSGSADVNNVITYDDVSRSHGLQIVMPAGAATAMPNGGQGSLLDYQQQFASTAWNSFLQRWAPLVQGLRPFVDVGINTTTVWEAWDSAFVSRGNMEMLLLEPDGTLYGPILGTVSVSGDFSADARDANTYYEGWASHRFVESGTFYFLAWLVSDPSNYQPLVNVAYQQGTEPVVQLYHPGTYPQLSMQRSFRQDPTPTNARILGNYYTDLQVVSTWTTGSGSLVDAVASMPAAGGGSASIRASAPVLSVGQINTLRRVLTQGVPAQLRSPGLDPEAIRRSIQQVLANAPGRVPR
jgi:hypothetical protein